jgi:transcriptional regulator with XRE-family HTH domain
MFQRIRNLREDNDLTQKQLAKLLNVSQATYSRYEQGELDIPIQSLIKLAQYYSTSIDYLVNLTNIKVPYSKD